MKTVAIVGRGKTAKYAPFDNPNIDIWAFNDNAMTLPRVEAMFEMHPDWDDTERLNGVPGIDEYRQWLRKPHPFPIYMHDRDPRVPASVDYPINAITFLFHKTMWKGKHEIQHFYTSTTPEAIALAIHKVYERIELYGVELTQEFEYANHRDSVFFWLGRATGAGIQVAIHEESKLYDSALYPLK